MQNSLDLIKNLYLKVEFDHQGSIIAFETTMAEFANIQNEWMGKNWFEDFISPSDQSILRKEYAHLFEDKYSEIVSLKHDLLTPDHKHLYMIFDPDLKINGERKSLVLIGHEYHLISQKTHSHHHNINTIDDLYLID